MAANRGRDRAVADALVGGRGTRDERRVDLERAQGAVAIDRAFLRVGRQLTDEFHLGEVLSNRLDDAFAITAGVLADGATVRVLPGAEVQRRREVRLGCRGRGDTTIAGGLHILSRSNTSEGEGRGGSESKQGGADGFEERVHGVFS